MSLYTELIKLVLADYIYCFDQGRSSHDKFYGRYWPSHAHTMAGLARLNNTEWCCRSVIEDNIPGDFLEAGVWRGGVTILMRAILADMGIADRLVWVADSFNGLPPPDQERFPKDTYNIKIWKDDRLAISLEQVQENFRRYELLDDQVRFLSGYFEQTMPDNQVGQLAVLRLDGDMYGSTWVCLEHLYPKLSPGGYCIIDDYYAMRQATQATDDYREQLGIKDELIKIEPDADDKRGWGVFWRKS